MTPPILAVVRRGETIESLHRGHVCAVDGDGKTILSIGEPETVTFFRSAAKPFQALPFILSGAADELGYAEEEIALACASHSGQPEHVAIATRMLERCKLSESDLQCGVHKPFNEKEAERLMRAGEKPTQLHNNCSGKHAAMLAFAKHIGADIDNYLSSPNPIQKAILKSVSNFAELPVEEIATAVDGCAAPNFALPVTAMARSFANLIRPAKFDADVQAACARVVSAMGKYPNLMGGDGRLDTQLIEAADGKIVSKVGADGVWLCGVLPSAEYPAGLGIALKIENGDDFLARPVVAVELLKHFRILSPDVLQNLSPMPIKNRRGDIVGRIECVASFESDEASPDAVRQPARTAV